MSLRILSNVLILMDLWSMVGSFVAPVCRQPSSRSIGCVAFMPSKLPPQGASSVLMSGEVDTDEEVEATTTTTEASTELPTTTVEETEETVEVPEAGEADAVADDEPVVASEGEEDTEGKKQFQRERHTLFVGGLPFEVTDTQVKELFEPYGNVEFVSIPRDRESGLPRGFGFVDMGSEEELDKCIEAIDGDDSLGRTLRVTRSLTKEEMQNRQVERKTPNNEIIEEGFKKVYLGNIPYEMTEDGVRDLFKDFGEVKNLYIPVDRTTGMGRGFAFVTLEEEGADSAIEALNGVEYEGRILTVGVPRAPGDKDNRRGGGFNDNRTKIYVGNLSFYTLSDTLIQMFQEFGEVYDCFIPEDPVKGGSRGFGFVTIDKDAAEVAIRELDGCEVDGRTVRVNEAQPKRPPRNYDDDFDTPFDDE